MKIWILHHVRALLATMGRFQRAPVSSFFNVAVTGVTLALPVSFYVGLVSLESLSHKFAADPEISLFLSLDAGRADVMQIENRLKQHPDVRAFQYVPREQALQDLKDSTGLADVISTLPQNPLPDAFVVRARNDGAQSLKRLRDEMQGWPKVARVQFDAEWARRLEAVLALGRLAVAMLTTMLAFALIAVTFNTIRLQILTRREEIEVARLIGATDPFIRRPFLYFGALQGLAGGLAAWGIVWIGVRLLNEHLADLSQLYGMALQVRHLAPRDSVSLLLFSAGLGWLGARLSVGRHLSGFTPR